MEDLRVVGVHELTVEEQRGILGGNDVARGVGRFLGAIAEGIVNLAEAIVDAVGSYENPRYNGGWQG